MNSMFEDLKQGLQEAIAYEKENGEGRKVTYQIQPLRSFSNAEIRKIRMDAGMTQSVFALYMGVSNKTVEAWENGRTHPTGPACRLLEVLESEQVDSLQFIRRKE